MINASKKFKKEILQNRNFYVTADCTLSDGTILKLKKEDFYNTGNGIVDASDSSEFPLGEAIEKTATLSLVNDDDRFSDYNFNAARFILYLNLLMADGTLEIIRRGTFTVSKKPSKAQKINLTLLDKMHNADMDYSTNLIFPATAGEVLRDSCQTCGISVGDASFPNDDFVIQEKPTNVTHRAVIGACAMLAGGNARIDENDRLRIVTFAKDVFQDTQYDGGSYVPWTTGDILDGGTMNPWTEGQTIDGGSFTDSNGYHVFSRISNLQIDTDDIEVSAVKTKVDETVYQYGSDGYAVSIKNPLISGNENEALQRIGERIIGLKMRPFSCRSIAYPLATFMDPAYVTDIKDRYYATYLTNIEFLFNGYTTISNNTKSAVENETEFYDSNDVAVEQAKKEIKKGLSAYDIAVQSMNQLAANTLGFFYTQVNSADGSIISYRHDKPELADSQIIYKSGIDGFFLSVDGGKTWKAGFDSNGDAVLNILYAIGIQAEWINTRGLTAKDNSGNITFRVDADTGRVDIVANSFSLRGKSIDEIAEQQVNDFVNAVYDPKIKDLQNQIDGQIETWYYDYEPTLTNAPASGWTTEAEKSKHEGDLFYWKSKGFAYRFYKEGSTWKWQMVQDTDITKAMAQAAEAQDTADEKRRVFISTPVPPYDVGDLWFNGTASDIMTCIKQRSSGSYSSSDWQKRNKYVDETAVDNAIDQYDDSLGQLAVFNKLTNNGQTQGIFLQNGKIYINGEFINAKGMRVTNSAGNQTFYIDSSGNVSVSGEFYSSNYNNWGNEWISIKDAIIKGGIYSVYDSLIDLCAQYSGGRYLVLENTDSGIRLKGKQVVIETLLKVLGDLTVSGTINTNTINAKYYLDRNGGKHELAALLFNSNPVFDTMTVIGEATFTSGIQTHGTSHFGYDVYMEHVRSYGTQTTSPANLFINSSGKVVMTSNSSKRYKNHVRYIDISDAEGLYSIPVAEYIYKPELLSKDDERYGKGMVGIYAEDVEKYFPIACEHKDGKPDDWNSRILVPAMLKLIQSQHEEIKELKRRETDLESRLAKLEQMIGGGAIGD